MKYWIFRLDFSQTDHEYKVVRAYSEEIARKVLTEIFKPRYVTCYGSVDYIL